jgi:hypothetical protein
VIVWPNAGEGNFAEGLFFVNVYPDLKSLGVADFQGQNDFCNFRAVFSQLVGLKTIPFTCRQTDNPNGNFVRLQEAESKGEMLIGAKLYVHRRDQSEFDTIQKGIGIMLDDVKVAFTAANNGSYYAQLYGKKAKGENF